MNQPKNKPQYFLTCTTILCYFLFTATNYAIMLGADLDMAKKIIYITTIITTINFIVILLKLITKNLSLKNNKLLIYLNLFSLVNIIYLIVIFIRIVSLMAPD